MTNQNALYDEILSHGASSETLRILLRELKKQDAPQELLRECLKAVQAYPRDLYLSRMLAESYAEVGFLSQAERELEKITSGMGELVQAYKLQADIYRRQNRPGEAIRSLRIYLAHCPEDHEALDVFEDLHASRTAPEAKAPEGREPESLQSAPAAPQESPEPPDEAALPEIATSTLAEVYVHQGEVAEAVTIYRKVLAGNPHDEKARQRLEELQSMVPAEPAATAEKPDRAGKKKERAIAILEAWLTDLRKTYRESAAT